jgi:hypothetical protein
MIILTSWHIKVLMFFACIKLTGNDPKLRASLNWERRLEIIRGVAKGVAYLHGDLS